MKLLLIIMLILSPSLSYAQDRVSVRVEFKKFVWTCPQCKNEEIQDAIVSGGNDYTHTCSKCGAEFNQSGPNMKEYNGTLSYPYETYDKATDINTKKEELCSKWLYEVKNPPPYIEPKVSDYDQMIADKQEEITSLQARKAELEATIISD